MLECPVSEGTGATDVVRKKNSDSVTLFLCESLDPTVEEERGQVEGRLPLSFLRSFHVGLRYKKTNSTKVCNLIFCLSDRILFV